MENYILPNIPVKVVYPGASDLRKIQETDTTTLVKCLDTIYFNKRNFNEICNEQSMKQVSQEMFKRAIVPLYVLIVSLIASSLVIKPKIFLLQKYTIDECCSSFLSNLLF